MTNNDVVFRLKAPTEGFNYLRFLQKERLKDLQNRLLRELVSKTEKNDIALREYK